MGKMEIFESDCQPVYQLKRIGSSSSLSSLCNSPHPTKSRKLSDKIKDSFINLVTKGNFTMKNVNLL